MVGEKVKLRRCELGLSQTKLANALGLTFQQVQKYESGANRIGAGRIFQLSQILDVPMAYFFEDIPPAVRESKATARDMDEMSSPLNFGSGRSIRRETLELVKSYISIEDDKVRMRLRNLARTISQSNGRRSDSGRDRTGADAEAHDLVVSGDSV
jgi:transcriptional regulator with XRE-family HTH domain